MKKSITLSFVFCFLLFGLILTVSCGEDTVKPNEKTATKSSVATNQKDSVVKKDKDVDKEDSEVEGDETEEEDSDTDVEEKKLDKKTIEQPVAEKKDKDIQNLTEMKQSITALDNKIKSLNEELKVTTQKVAGHNHNPVVDTDARNKIASLKSNMESSNSKIADVDRRLKLLEEVDRLNKEKEKRMKDLSEARRLLHKQGKIVIYDSQGVYIVLPPDEVKFLGLKIRKIRRGRRLYKIRYYTYLNTEGKEVTIKYLVRVSRKKNKKNRHLKYK